MATGLPKGRGVYVVDAVLDQPGTYQGEVLYQGHRLPLALQVKTTADVPVPGDTASHVPSHQKVKSARGEPDLYPAATVLAACRLAVGRRGRGEAGCGSVRDAGALSDPLLRTGAERAPRGAAGLFQNDISFVHVEIYQVAHRDAGGADGPRRGQIPS